MRRVPCPECRKAGRDDSGDNLAIYEDGHGHCFSCGTHFAKSRIARDFTEAKMSKLTVSECQTYPVGHDPRRMVPREVVEAYDVRVEYSETDRSVTKLFYPYYDKGKVVAFKIRGKDKSFSWAGKNERSLFGMNTCKGTDYLLVTEGEEDALAAKSLLSCLGKPVDIDVVSLPNGAALDNTVRQSLEFLQGYKRIYLCLDSDEPGKKATVAIADWLATHTDVYTVDLERKDASEYLMQGEDESVTDFKRALKNAKKYEPEGIVNGITVPLKDLLIPLEAGFDFPFPKLQERLHGLRKKEILTICAGPGIGKSTFSTQLAYHLICQGHSIAKVDIEDTMDVSMQRLLALDMKIPLARFRSHPPPEAAVKASYEKLVANGRTYFYKQFGGIKSQSLLDKLYYYARIAAVDFIFFDHLSMVLSATKAANERQEIDWLMTELAKLVVETGVGLINVVHLKRREGTSYNRGGEIELSDLRGSAALEQLSWAVVGLERDQQGEDANFMRSRVLKNRTWGFTGLADTLKYDTDTGWLVPVIADAPEPLGELEEIISGVRS